MSELPGHIPGFEKMADKISGLGKPGTNSGLTRARSSGEAGQSDQTQSASSQSGTRPPGDQVQLTEAATRLKIIEARLGELDGIDHQRVAELRQQIESGEYEIDARKIAASLLALESKLIS
jgi:negative regulator of flagellin synthesis FlgM